MFCVFRGKGGAVSLQLRLAGGARSLALTLLRPNSLLTGKNTGNLRNFALENALSLSKLHILLEEIARSAEIGTGIQGINREVSGNLFPDQGSYCRTELAERGFCGNPNCSRCSAQLKGMFLHRFSKFKREAGDLPGSLRRYPARGRHRRKPSRHRRRESGLAGQRSHVERFSFKHFFVPAVSSRHCLYQ